MNTVHVIGGGLAGLSAALSLAERGRRVVVYEAGPACGGRARSYHDRHLGCRLDNGNHLLLSANRTVFDYLDRIGARDRLMVPLAVSVLNTRPEQGSAALMGRVMRESMAKGGSACVPWFPREGLSESLVDPALARLGTLGAVVRTGARVTGLGMAGGLVDRLRLSGGEVALEGGDAVVLALPAQTVRDVAAEALPGLVVPDAFESILNLHYRAEVDGHLTGDLARARFAGVVGGLAEWVFVKPGILSVTVSAANHLSGEAPDAVAAAIWRELRAVVKPFLRPGAPPGALPEALPPHRVVREKRATFAATPAQERMRPECRTAVSNLVLAGDWTATGLPATIEGAMRSGVAAATVLSSPSGPPASGSRH